MHDIAFAWYVIYDLFHIRRPRGGTPCLLLFMAVKIDLKKLPLYNDNIDLSFSNWYCLRVYIPCLKCPSQWYDACQSTETQIVLLYPKLSVILPTVTLSTSKGNM